MIKINLLKGKKNSSATSSGGVRFLGIDTEGIDRRSLVVTVAIFLLSSFPSWFLEEELKKIQNHNKSLEKEIGEIDKKIQENASIKKQLEDFQKEYKILQEKQSQVITLIEKKTNPKRLLESVARKIPEDIWLDSLVIDSNKQLEVKGLAKSFKSIGTFRQQMGQLPFFKHSPDLKNWETTKIYIPEKKEEVSVQSFLIKGAVDVFNP